MPAAAAAGYGLRRVHAAAALPGGWAGRVDGRVELTNTDSHSAAATADGTAPADGVAGGAEARSSRSLLVTGPPGTVSPSLIHALEREFPWVRVEHRDDVAGLSAAASHPVALILVDCSFLERLEAAAADILRRHPQAIAALVEKSGHQPARSFPEVAGSRLVRGVLPMNLGLDVWLSVVRLMLCGGDYFPAHLFHPQRDGAPAAARRDDAAEAAADGQAEGAIDGLTRREVQILEMVSRGLQNKSIAAAFSLSESTVKIHIHNIISKLGVHNRTEAAARYHDRPGGRPDMRPAP